MLIRIGIVLFILALIASTALFRVNQWEQAVVFEFGDIVRVESDAGLHFMIPVMNNARKFEKRLLNLERDAQRFLTKEKKDVLVDYYAKWSIADVGKFYTASNGGDINYANNLLGQRINQALRDEFGKRTVQEVVAGEREEILNVVTTTTAELTGTLGIAVKDVRTKRIDLPDEVSENVYSRMRSERSRVAKDFRARGEEKAERIRASADREREVILANAYRESETIRGEGDAQATEVYAASFGKDEEFYGLYRSLNAYQTSFGDGKDVLLLEPDSEFFQYFKNRRGK
ncbi:MAG: protease modulator HflC [Gammaproteobacteria bacterium]|nr:protease modulator HflC [Gammaproteobacteria bacterium]